MALALGWPILSVACSHTIKVYCFKFPHAKASALLQLINFTITSDKWNYEIPAVEIRIERVSNKNLVYRNANFELPI